MPHALSQNYIKYSKIHLIHLALVLNISASTQARHTEETLWHFLQTKRVRSTHISKPIRLHYQRTQKPPNQDPLLQCPVFRRGGGLTC